MKPMQLQDVATVKAFDTADFETCASSVNALNHKEGNLHIIKKLIPFFEWLPYVTIICIMGFQCLKSMIYMFWGEVVKHAEHYG